jgi:hypothetical protein
VNAGACFARPAGGEVMVGPRKVVGSAQLREGTALLQHGSLLLADDQATVAAVTLGEALPHSSAPLAWLIARAVSREMAGDAVAAAAARRWGPPAARVAAPAAVLARAEHYAPRFRSPAWTWAGTAA